MKTERRSSLERTDMENVGGKRMASSSTRKTWENIPPEILALFLMRIPTDEVARTIPFVCRSWKEALGGPDCWSELDVEQWCRRVGSTPAIDVVVRLLVRRSAGTLRSLRAYRVGNPGFDFACSNGKHLSVLCITMSEVSDQMVEKHAHSFPKLTVLDISYCLNISSKGIELLGRHCKSIVQLRRNMPPPAIEMTLPENGAAAKIDESEAMAIASSMPCLEHLELAFGKFSDNGLEAILRSCRAITLLDIRGCWSVRLEGGLEPMCDGIKFFRDPWEDEYENPDTPNDEGDAPSPPAVDVAEEEEEGDDWDWDNDGDDDVVGAPADVVNVFDDDNDVVDAPVHVVNDSDSDDDAGDQIELVEISDDD